MILLGEKLNSSIPSVLEAIRAKDGEAIRSLASAQEKAGADFLDINAGMMQEEETSSLLWMMEEVRAVSSLPLVIDSPDPAVSRAAMENYTGPKPILNSVTLDPMRLDPMLELAVQKNASLVALCMDNSDCPDETEHRIAAADELVETITAAGLTPEDIYLDPLIHPVSADPEAGKNALRVIRAIRQKHPQVHIACGLSNVSYGLPARGLLNRAFLVCAMAAGLDSAILNPLDRELMSLLRAARALLGEDKYCMDYIESFREGLLG